ncbi:PREDICTED: uncharacterized protein LOC104812187 isoform X2 [Tarenaya hassleriana]|nr:PREDICTED: uncharacterized protein LOC104812187 isoform X2 [Tarenaya hassleriana]
MQEVAGERGGYLHGRGALDSDDLLYLKEQMEAEEDAERLLRRTEKRAFAAFKKAASQADSSTASLPLPLRVEPKPKSGIRQQDLLKKVVEVKPKRPKVSNLPSRSQSPPVKTDRGPTDGKIDSGNERKMEEKTPSRPDEPRELPGGDKTDGEAETRRKIEGETAVRSLLGLAYESSDEE